MCWNQSQHLYNASDGRVRNGILTVMVGLFLCSVTGQGCWADTLTPAMRAADPRLQTRVSLRSPRILVGELLERLSRQSGVAVTANDWSTAGCDEVAVSFTDVPLADAMDALWSLFSYQNADWEWRRNGTPGAYTYQIFRPSTARSLPEQLHEQVQADFEAQTQRLIDALNMPQDQLKTAAKNDPLLNSLLMDGRVGPGMRLFASLSPELQQHLLNGGDPYTVSVSDLPPDGQDDINQMWMWENNTIAKQTGRPSVPPIVPKHTQIKIFAARTSDMISPALFLDTGQGSGQYSGGAWLDADWGKKMHAEWMLPGDMADDPASNRAPLPPLEQPCLVTEGHLLSPQLMTEADATRISMIARIPTDLDGTAASLPVNDTITAFFKTAKTDPFNLDHKWRDGILLVTCQNWFVNAHEDARVPWAEVARLRDDEAKSPDGILPLADLSRAAYLLTPAQLHTLSEWFPVMEYVATWHDFLAYLDQSPEYLPHLISATGDTFEQPQELVADQLGIESMLQEGRNLRLRLRERQITAFGRPTQQIIIEALNNADGKVVRGQGFGYAGHEYQSHLQVFGPSTTPIATR